MSVKPDPSRDLVNRMIEEVQNQKSLERFDEIFAEDFVNHTPPPGAASDRAGMRQLLHTMNVAFPDAHVHVEDQISDGRRVWTRKKFTGTHTGPLGGIAASGKRVSYEVIDILVVENGKLTQHWSVIDRLDLFQQLGLRLSR